MIDLSRYQGLWYELAHTENPWESQCTISTASYHYDQRNNTMRLVNTCYLGNGQTYSVNGIGYPKSYNELSVQFEPSIFNSGNTGRYIIYWTDYTNYSIVYGDKFVWLLGRIPTLYTQDFGWINDKLINLGINPKDMLINRSITVI